ncbi:hypothetical protein KC322_g17680 [Hortaea werneckii]|nr:hypothetical protein KC322_g17680 [Hortaea werneckii]
MDSVSKLKARVTGTANSLITATKQHASSPSLSPATQSLQHNLRTNLLRHRLRHAREKNSDDAQSLRILELATKGMITPSADRRGRRRLGIAGRESSGRSSACGSCGEDEMGRGRGRRRRSPRGRGGSEMLSCITCGSGGGSVWRVGCGPVGVETELPGSQRGWVRRGGCGGLGQQEDSALGFCSHSATTTIARGVVATTEANDDDDDDDEEEDEEEETWDLIPTPPSPLSTTNPAPALRGTGGESPDPLTRFHQSGNPLPSSRSVTVSPSSSDAEWQGGLLHEQEKEEERDEGNEESSLVFANEHKKPQNHFPGNRVGEWSDTFSSPSFASQRGQEQLLQQPENHQHPHSRAERSPPRASGEVLAVVQECANPEMTERERGGYEGIGTQSPGGGELLGSRGGDGWGVFGGGGEMRGQGVGGEEGWEVV